MTDIKTLTPSPPGLGNVALVWLVRHLSRWGRGRTDRIEVAFGAGGVPLSLRDTRWEPAGR